MKPYVMSSCCFTNSKNYYRNPSIENDADWLKVKVTALCGFRIVKI